MRVVIDTSVFIGVFNKFDPWFTRASQMRTRLIEENHALIFFDIVVAEASGTATRRLREQKRIEFIPEIMKRMALVAPYEEINWISHNLSDWYAECLTFIVKTDGKINFNDALIAIACRELKIPFIASFDRDFDTFPWLTRWSLPEHIVASDNEEAEDH